MSNRALQTAVLALGCTLAATGVARAQSKTVPVRVAAPQTQTTVQELGAEVPVEEDIVVDTSIAPPVAKVTAVTAAVPAVAGVAIVCPVPGAKFTNDYGAPRAGHAHAGIDMLAPRGTPILAPVAGTVKHQMSSLGGLSFYLDLPTGEQYFGTHMLSVGASGTVAAGTVIGYVGDSGNAKGTPHLHFEYHPTKKTKANPYPLLVKACRPT